MQGVLGSTRECEIEATQISLVYRSQNKITRRISALAAAGHPTNGKAILKQYQQAIDLLGNINLTEDEYCMVGEKRFVIDFKSGFGSNEKGNTERLLTVAKIYGLLPESHECVLVVRAAEDEGNNYLQVLKTSGLWKVCCGPAAHEIHQGTHRFRFGRLDR